MNDHAKAPTKPIAPLKPRRKLFYLLLTVYALCMVGLVVMYYTTVRS